jgi:hypothetical protein
MAAARLGTAIATEMARVSEERPHDSKVWAPKSDGANRGQATDRRPGPIMHRGVGGAASKSAVWGSGTMPGRTDGVLLALIYRAARGLWAYSPGGERGSDTGAMGLGGRRSTSIPVAGEGSVSSLLPPTLPIHNLRRMRQQIRVAGAAQKPRADLGGRGTGQLRSGLHTDF